MFMRSLLRCTAYCFIARFGGIKVLLSPTLLFFICPPDSSSLVSCNWGFVDPPSWWARSNPFESASTGEWQSLGMTVLWRSLSCANLHLIPNLHFPSFLYDTHTFLPPIWAGLVCTVRGTCFCRALSLWSAWALNGLANTLLPAQLFREGGGNLLGLRESSREGGGKLALHPALVAAAAVWRSREEEEGSGSSSTWPESLSDSLDPEPVSSNRFRVFPTGDTSSAASLTGLQKRKRRDISWSYHKHWGNIVLLMNATSGCGMASCHVKTGSNSVILPCLRDGVLGIFVAVRLWRQTVADERVHGTPERCPAKAN